MSFKSVYQKSIRLPGSVPAASGDDWLAADGA
jgi:hypothetical protein